MSDRRKSVVTWNLNAQQADGNVSSSDVTDHSNAHHHPPALHNSDSQHNDNQIWTDAPNEVSEVTSAASAHQPVSVATSHTSSEPAHHTDTQPTAGEASDDSRDAHHHATLQRIMLLSQSSNMPPLADTDSSGEADDKQTAVDVSVFGRLAAQDPALFVSSGGPQTQSFVSSALRSALASGVASATGAALAVHCSEGGGGAADSNTTNARRTNTNSSLVCDRGSRPRGGGGGGRAGRWEKLFEARRSQYALLDKIAVHSKRSSALHNSCVDTLVGGCVLAHAQLLDIAGGGGGHCLVTPQVLAELQSALMDIERACRKLDFAGAYRRANGLAVLFGQGSDGRGGGIVHMTRGDLALRRSRLCLARRLFVQSLHIAECVAGGDGVSGGGLGGSGGVNGVSAGEGVSGGGGEDSKYLAEAHCNLAVVSCFLDEWEAALVHVRQFRRLSRGRRWEIPNGHAHHQYACMLEQCVCRRRAELCADPLRSLELFQRGAALADQSQNTGARAMAQCDLGDALCRVQRWQQALTHYHSFMSCSDKLLNFNDSCRALIKLSQCYNRLGNRSMAVDQLQYCYYIGSQRRVYRQVVRACIELGCLHLARPDSHKADVQAALCQFKRAQQHVIAAAAAGAGARPTSVSRTSRLADTSAVLVGAAAAQLALPAHIQLIYQAGGRDLAALHAWKNDRKPVELSAVATTQ